MLFVKVDDMVKERDLVKDGVIDCVKLFVKLREPLCVRLFVKVWVRVIEDVCVKELVRDPQYELELVD